MKENGNAKPKTTRPKRSIQVRQTYPHRCHDGRGRPDYLLREAQTQGSVAIP